MTQHTVFVYGTLRPGNPANQVTINGSMYNLGWFPGIKLGGERSFVAETVTVDDEGLHRLDGYEGYDPGRPETSLYIRVPFNGGWIYEYNGNNVSDEACIESGDWLEHVGETSGSASYMVVSATQGFEEV